MSVRHKVSNSTNANEWDSDSDESTSWIASYAADVLQVKPTPVTSPAKQVQEPMLHPDSLVFELTWADKTRKGTGIAAAYIKALYETKTNSEGQSWEETTKKLHEQGLNVAKRRLGDMRTGERPMLPSHALKVYNLFIP